MPRARKPARRSDSRSKEGQGHPLRIAVKINNRTGKPPQQLDGWQRLLEHVEQPLETLRLLPLIESHQPKQLTELVDRARRNEPDYEVPDFSAWFQVVCPSGVSPDELARA